MDVLQLVECSIPIVEQLAIEEALLRVEHGNWCLLNHNSPPAIILGLSSSLEELVDQERLLQKPIPLIRRFSGGGTVVVDEDTLFFTLILEKKTFPAELMQWTEELLAPLFLPETFFVAEHDYAVQGKKVGGNAQSFSGNRVLHHTSFLWSWKKELFSYLKNPAQQPAYRKFRTHEEFCGKLSLYFPSKETFFSKLKQALSHQFSLEKTSLEEAKTVLSTPHLKRLQEIG